MTDHRRWSGPTNLPDGHRIFERQGPDGLERAIADDSGRTPELTDDGLLFLDPSRSLIVMAEGEDEHLAIPLIDERGKRTRTPTDAASLLYLSREYGWTIHDEVRERFYNVR